MALVLKDRIKETSSTTGQGTLTLGGAVDGFRTFADIGNANTTYYCITDGNLFEVGIGTYTASGTTLARTTVLQTSAGNTTKISCTGNQKVFVTQPASKAAYLDASDSLVVDGATSSAIQQRWTKTATSNQTVFSGAADSSGPTLAVNTTSHVFLNGTFLKETTDYALSGGNTVTLTSGVAVNDIVEVITFTLLSTAITGITSGKVPVFTSGVADNDFLKIDGTSVEGRDASQVLSDIGAIANVSEDTSPQLGANLDVVTHSIVTTSNRDINLVPNGSGSVHIQTTSSASDLKITDTSTDNSAGPRIRLARSSSSPADSDYIGAIDFYGKNDADQDVEYAAILGRIYDASDGTEDGNIEFWNKTSGTSYKGAELDRFRLKAQYTGQYKNHLASIAASDDAILSLNGYMSTAYKIYEILFVNMVPATNGVDLVMNCGNGGSEITQHYGWYNNFAGTSGTDATQTDTSYYASGTGGISSAGRWKISGKDEFDVGNTSAEGVTGLVRLYNTQDSGRYVNGHVDHCAYQSDDGYAVNSYLSTFRGNFGTTLVTDINIAFDSGNISSGTMYLYGIYVG